MDKISFFDTETNEELEGFVLEQTILAGTTYLLVTEEEVDDSLAYILKEVKNESEDTVYEMVVDDTELEAISKVFSEMLSDIDFEL